MEGEGGREGASLVGREGGREGGRWKGREGVSKLVASLQTGSGTEELVISFISLAITSITCSVIQSVPLTRFKC